MRRYIDSSLLVTLYYPEDLSDEVTEMVRERNDRILFSSLHELEIKNALALKVFRKEMKEAQALSVLADIESDIQADVLERIPLDWGAVFSQALKLSGLYTRKTGARTLDILHVSAALYATCTHFATHDKRQADMAEKAGMSVIMIERYIDVPQRPIPA